MGVDGCFLSLQGEDSCWSEPGGGRRRKEQAYRPGTRANVRSHTLLYVAFSQFYDFRDLQATVAGLLAFAEFLARSYVMPKSVFNALASVKHYHLDFRLSTAAFEDRALALWKRALLSTARAVSRPAPPLTQGLLVKLCRLAAQLGPLGTVMCALMAVTFATMARLSSLLPVSAAGFDATRLPCWGDFRAEGPEGGRLLIKWAKAHQQANQGFWVPLLASQVEEVCPLACLGRLRQVLGNVGGLVPLFCLPDSAARVTSTVVPLSMPLARRWLKILLIRVGESPDAFSFHSFRRGACSLAFQGGATEGDIKQLGGWRSDAVRAYLPAFEARRRAALVLSGGRGGQSAAK